MDIKIIIAFFIIASPTALAVGIGVSPDQIDLKNAIRGGELDRSLTIFNPDDNANNYTVRVEGDSKDWINFYDIDMVTPVNQVSIAGKGNRVIVLKIKIPQDAPSGNYNSTVYVETNPIKDTNIKIGVIAKLAATADVRINITGDQILDGTVRAVTAEDTEPGFPMRINTVFQNTGNVIADPTISVDVIKDNNSIDNFIDQGHKIKPSLTDNLITEWNTTSSTSLGNYNAIVRVSFNGKDLKNETLSFKVLPVGTLSRNGDLTEILIEGEPAVDTIAKVKAVFKNTGQIETSAKFSGEVYQNNKLIDTLSSDELTVQKNREIVLISYLKLTAPGDYLVKGKVIYSGKETAVKEISLNVSEPKATPGFEGIYAVVLLVILMIHKRVGI